MRGRAINYRAVSIFRVDPIKKGLVAVCDSQTHALFIQTQGQQLVCGKTIRANRQSIGTGQGDETAVRLYAEGAETMSTAV